MRKKIKLRSEGISYSGKKCKRGYGGAYGGAETEFGGSQAVRFGLVRFVANMFSHPVYF
jgi:hypothetical protein